MNKKLLPLLSLLILAHGTPAQAAYVAPHYAAAQEKLNSEGYVVIFHPKGWDDYGAKAAQALSQSKEVLLAAGNAVILNAPVYEAEDEASKEAAKAIMGKLAYPHPHSDVSYPAVGLYDSSGRLYSLITGGDVLNARSTAVAKSIQTRKQALLRQETLLKQAETSTDSVQKARLLLQTARIPQLNRPADLEKKLQAADPEDKSGCLAALRFYNGAPNEKELRAMTVEAFLANLEKHLANELLTTEQKQNACAFAIGHIRRSLGPVAGGPFITRLAATMKALAPASKLGRSADIVARDWVQDFTIEEGWNPDRIPGQRIPMELKGNFTLGPKGTYSITFAIITGRDCLEIAEVALYDGDTLVSSDKRVGIASHAKNEVYKVTAPTDMKAPRIMLTFANPPDKRSSWGRITLSHQP